MEKEDGMFRGVLLRKTGIMTEKKKKKSDSVSAVSLESDEVLI